MSAMGTLSIWHWAVLPVIVLAIFLAARSKHQKKHSEIQVWGGLVAKETQVASIFPRLVGGIIDYLIILSISIGIYILALIYFSSKNKMGFQDEYYTNLLIALFNAIFLATNCIYMIFLQSGENQSTFGQRAMGLRVSTLDGSNVSLGRATIRYLASMFSSLLLLMGYLVALFAEKKQTLHDVIAGTLVLRAVQSQARKNVTARSGIIERDGHEIEPEDPYISEKFGVDGKITELEVEDCWEQASSELNSDSRREGLWAKCFAEANGEERQAKLMYLKTRANQLMAEKLRKT